MMHVEVDQYNGFNTAPKKGAGPTLQQVCFNPPPSQTWPQFDLISAHSWLQDLGSLGASLPLLSPPSVSLAGPSPSHPLSLHSLDISVPLETAFTISFTSFLSYGLQPCISCIDQPSTSHLSSPWPELISPHTGIAVTWPAVIHLSILHATPLYQQRADSGCLMKQEVCFLNHPIRYKKNYKEFCEW